MGGDSGNGVTWGKIAQVAISVILTALIAVIGFLVTQVMSLKDEISELKVNEAQHYGQLSKDIALQELTVKNLSAKIDKITVTRLREEPP